MRRIDSRLIFNILRAVSEKSNNQIYKSLWIHESSGPRFKDGLKGKGWWPKQEAWFDNALMDLGGDDSQLIITEQMFPPGSAYPAQDAPCSTDPGSPGLGSHEPDSAGQPITFESHLYRVLMEMFDEYLHQDADRAKQIILSNCLSFGVAQNDINYLAGLAGLEDMVRSMIRLAKESAGKPLELKDPVSVPLSPSAAAIISDTFSSAHNLFSLQDLRALLTGIPSNWPDKLRLSFDRSDFPAPDHVGKRVIAHPLSHNRTFLQAILPAPTLDLIEEHAAEDSALLQNIMVGRHQDELRSEICTSFATDSGWRLRELVRKCRSLLAKPADLAAYQANVHYMFSLLSGPEATHRHVHNCYRRCADRQYLYRGLAVLILAALLGTGHFSQLIATEDDCAALAH